MQAIKQGKSNKILAHELNLDPSTVKLHLRNVMRKMNAKIRTRRCDEGLTRWRTPRSNPTPIVGGAGPWIQHKTGSGAVLGCADCERKTIAAWAAAMPRSSSQAFVRRCESNPALAGLNEHLATAIDSKPLATLFAIPRKVVEGAF